MKIKFITLFPDLIRSYLADALIAKAVEKNLLSFEIINLRDFSDNAYKSVDDSPFGGGDGMLMRADILEKALFAAKTAQANARVVYLSPQGKVFNSEMAREFAGDLNREVIFICGRYAGIDQRFIDKYVDEEISVGDYVLSGGELPALVLTEAISRYVPGVLGKMESAENDSFANGLLEPPQYTRPQVWDGLKVPDVLLSGNHKKIQEWKDKMALEVTRKKRPDLLRPKIVSGNDGE